MGALAAGVGLYFAPHAFFLAGTKRNHAAQASVGGALGGVVRMRMSRRLDTVVLWQAIHLLAVLTQRVGWVPVCTCW